MRATPDDQGVDLNVKAPFEVLVLDWALLVLVPVPEPDELLEKGSVAVVVGIAVAEAPTPVRTTVSVGYRTYGLVKKMF